MFQREKDTITNIKDKVVVAIDDIDDAFERLPDYIMGGDEDVYGLLGSLEFLQRNLGDIKGKLEELLKKS